MAINPKNESALIMIPLPEYNANVSKIQIIKHDKFSQATGVVAVHNRYEEREFDGDSII